MSKESTKHILHSVAPQHRDIMYPKKRDKMREIGEVTPNKLHVSNDK